MQQKLWKVKTFQKLFQSSAQIKKSSVQCPQIGNTLYVIVYTFPDAHNNPKAHMMHTKLLHKVRILQFRCKAKRRAGSCGLLRSLWLRRRQKWRLWGLRGQYRGEWTCGRSQSCIKSLMKDVGCRRGWLGPEVTRWGTHLTCGDTSSLEIYKYNGFRYKVSFVNNFTNFGGVA